MKRHILKDDKSFPSQVFGIVSSKPFVQLAWNLAESLNLTLERDQDITQFANDEKQFWPRFTYFNKDSETTFSLIKNKGVDSLLAPELRNVDVFLVETNHYLTFQLSLENISKTSFVNFCFELETEMVKPETQQLLNIE